MWHISSVLMQTLSFLGESELLPPQKGGVALFETCKLLCSECDAWIFIHCMRNSADTVPTEFKVRMKRSGVIRMKVYTFWDRRRNRNLMDDIRLVARSLRPHFVLYALNPSLRHRRLVPACARGSALLSYLHPKMVKFCVEWGGVFRDGICHMAQIPCWAVQRRTIFTMSLKDTFFDLTRTFSIWVNIPPRWLTFRWASTGEEIHETFFLWERGICAIPREDAPAILVTIELPPDAWLLHVGTKDIEYDDSSESDHGSRERAERVLNTSNCGFFPYSGGRSTVEIPGDAFRNLEPCPGWLFWMDDELPAHYHGPRGQRRLLRKVLSLMSSAQEAGVAWKPPRSPCTLSRVTSVPAPPEGLESSCLCQYALTPVPTPSLYVPEEGMTFDFSESSVL